MLRVIGTGDVFPDGASAGGLLPVAFTLMAETVPAAHRGWLLVALGGIGTSTCSLRRRGHARTDVQLARAGCSACPPARWIVFSTASSPNRCGFLSDAGLPDRARMVLRRFAVQVSRRRRASRRAGDRRPASGTRPARAAAWLACAHQPGLLVRMAWGWPTSVSCCGCR